jgi:hypothetical protein
MPMIPYSKVAWALAPGIEIPDAVLQSFCQADQMIRHHSTAMLLVWYRVLWDWQSDPLRAIAAWIQSLDPREYYFLRTMEGDHGHFERFGEWAGNPFELEHHEQLSYLLNGIAVPRSHPNLEPHHLTYAFLRGRQLVWRDDPKEPMRDPPGVATPAQRAASPPLPKSPRNPELSHTG